MAGVAGFVNMLGIKVFGIFSSIEAVSSVGAVGNVVAAGGILSSCHACGFGRLRIGPLATLATWQPTERNFSRDTGRELVLTLEIYPRALTR